MKSPDTRSWFSASIGDSRVATGSSASSMVARAAIHSSMAWALPLATESSCWAICRSLWDWTVK